MEKKKKQDIEVVRHSLAHVLAGAVTEIFDEVKLAIGPAVQNGFYYDFDLPHVLTLKDLKILEKKMREIIKKNYQFEKTEMSIEEAEDFFRKAGQEYKSELISDLKKEGEKEVSVYQSGGFFDLCKGPHLDSTGEIPIDGFKLTKISGAYFKGDENNKMLQRVYGVAFSSKEELARYLKMMEEALKRDHRKLGKELDLFVFSELVGPGLPIYTPKGAILRKEIIRFSGELQKEIGYQEVHTPNINKAELFKVSGHYEKYKEDMFQVSSNYTKEEYFLKPMNCPQHTQIYASHLRSYKDLPVRISDFSNLYRDEKPGELSGLTRLRCFCQDDGHCFCREDQIKEEFLAVMGAIKKAMAVFKMDYTIRLSLWDPQKKEKYLGSKENWEKSQKILEEILVKNKIDYEKAIGEAAIYGPKMDLMCKDSIGREWQISTIQLDFIMPQRFKLTYIDDQGKEKTPVMIHRALLGSPERFLGVLIEHYAGAFPLWLSPVQVAVLPISEKLEKYAKSVEEKLKTLGVRILLDDSSNSLGKKIREAEKQKTPYMLILGEKEAKEKNLTVRKRGSREQETLPVEEFAQKIIKEIQERI